MFDLIKRRERTRILLVLALALGSTSATVGGMLAAFTCDGQNHLNAAYERFA